LLQKATAGMQWWEIKKGPAVSQFFRQEELQGAQRRLLNNRTHKVLVQDVFVCKRYK
jgi:hypothetical protein